MLKFNGAWRFHPPSTLSSQVINEFSDLIGKIAAQGDLQEVLEHFKNYFAGAAGTTSSWSSSASWAETDLHRLMNAAAENAPLLIASFYDACESLKMKNTEFYIPDTAMINAVLSKYGVEFELGPRICLRAVRTLFRSSGSEQPASLDEQAQEIIQQSLQQSEQFLAEGRHRQAVQEILWLLETVSTAFQGLDTGAGTVQGKYFNKIAEDLRRH